MAQTGLSHVTGFTRSANRAIKILREVSKYFLVSPASHCQALLGQPVIASLATFEIATLSWNHML